MKLKIVTVLVLSMCACAVNAFELKKECIHIETDTLKVRDCKNGTGESSEENYPDNYFFGLDYLQRRVIGIEGDPDSCYIDLARFNPFEDTGILDRFTSNTIPVVETNKLVLDSVTDSCKNVYVLGLYGNKSDELKNVDGEQGDMDQESVKKNNTSVKTGECGIKRAPMMLDYTEDGVTRNYRVVRFYRRCFTATSPN